MTRSNPGELVEPDEDIERTLHRRLREATTVCASTSRAGVVEVSLDSFDRLDETETPLITTPMAAPRRTLAEYERPDFTDAEFGIRPPPVAANTWEIKPSTIGMVQTAGQFHGLPNEDPHAHLTKFLRICSTFKLNNTTDDAIRLRLFPFSLSGAAATWYDGVQQGGTTSINTWKVLVERFLGRYFPPSKAARLRQDISAFHQGEQESLFEARERFNELLRKCPHHGYEAPARIQLFYNGLAPQTRQLIDAAAGGSLGAKYPEDAEALLESMAANESHWPSRSRQQKAPGLFEVSTDTALAAKVDALTSKIDRLVSNFNKPEAIMTCNTCGGGHGTAQCPIVITTPIEEVDYVSGGPRYQGNQFGGQQNQNWKQYPNQGYQGQQKQHGFQNPYQAPAPQPEKKSPFEEHVLNYMTNNDININALKAGMNSINLQLGQLLKATQERQQGGLPSNTEVNPKEQLKAITLRSGKVLETRAEQGPSVSMSRVPVREDPCVPTPPIFEEDQTDEVVEANPPPIEKAPAPRQTIPYPIRKKQSKDEAHYRRFMSILKQININLPMVEALTQMPKWAKFLKELLTHKRKIEDVDAIAINANCSAILGNRRLPPKLRDPGSFTIPCVFHGGLAYTALADSGASINVMPFSVYKEMGLDGLRPTTMQLQLADRSLKIPLGVIEDVIVGVGQLIFPADFVVLDIGECPDTPLILGRPFLNTASALIDLKEGTMTLRIGDHHVVHTLPDAMKQSMDFDDPCFDTHHADVLVARCVQEEHSKDPTWDSLKEDLDGAFPNPHFDPGDKFLKVMKTPLGDVTEAFSWPSSGGEFGISPFSPPIVATGTISSANGGNIPIFEPP